MSGHNVLPEFVDEIREVERVHGRVPGSTGGVINVVTKSGTNTWTSELLTNIEGNTLEGGRRRTLRLAPPISRGPSTSRPGRRLHPDRARRSIGGPIKRDRAWMFAAYQPALTRTERTVTFSFDGSTATKASSDVTHFFNVSQTAQVRPSLRTRVVVD